MTSIFFVIVRIYRSELNSKNLKNKKLFLNSFLHFWNLHSILIFLKKQMTIIVYVFPKLWTVIDVIRQMSKKPCLRTLFHSQHAKGSQALIKSTWQHFYHIFSLLWLKLSKKMYLLVICEPLGLFVNTLTADDNHSLRNREILPQSMQLQLSKRINGYFPFFCWISDMYIAL